MSLSWKQPVLHYWLMWRIQRILLLPWLGTSVKGHPALGLLVGLTKATVIIVLLISTVRLLPLPCCIAPVPVQVFLGALPSKTACSFQGLRVCFLGSPDYESSAIWIVCLRDFCVIKHDYIQDGF